MTITARQAGAVDLSLHPVWAVTMVKDEEDVIAGVVRHMAGEGVAGIIVADNGSTDATPRILQNLLDTDALGCKLILQHDTEVGYYQSRKMSALAARAAQEFGAKWIVPFDADELWLAPHAVARYLGAQPADVGVVTADLFHHLRTAVDEDVEDPFQSMVWRQRKPAGLPKVAFRWREGAVIHPGNHGVDLPADGMSAGQTPFRTAAGLEIRHFPFRSPEQFVSKSLNGAAAYAATDLSSNIGEHWRQYGLLHERGYDLGDVFREHFWYLAPTESGLIRDPAPYRRWEET